MVTRIDNTYQCEECGLRYEEKATAEECEQFCRENDACNTAIIQKSLDT